MSKSQRRMLLLATPVLKGESELRNDKQSLTRWMGLGLVMVEALVPVLISMVEIGGVTFGEKR